VVTSKQLPTGSVQIRPKRGLGGAGIVALLTLTLVGAVAFAGVGLFAPARLAVAHERALGLLHGGIAGSIEETYVDGCVAVEGADAPQAITRTRRVVSYGDGTSLEVVFSAKPAPTNVCP
jgi:hypothetical protein